MRALSHIQEQRIGLCMTLGIVTLCPLSVTSFCTSNDALPPTTTQVHCIVNIFVSYGPRLNLTKEEYMKPSPHNTTINHFYEKLFLLKDMLKTPTGKIMGQARHDFMVQYVNTFLNEWEGKE